MTWQNALTTWKTHTYPKDTLKRVGDLNDAFFKYVFSEPKLRRPFSKAIFR